MCIKCILCETTKVQNTLSNSLFLSLSLSLSGKYTEHNVIHKVQQKSVARPWVLL